MDAAAVAAAAGAAEGSFRVKRALEMAAYFGGFQAAMPALGWLAGAAAAQHMAAFAGMAAAALLAAVGAKMICAAVSGEETGKLPLPALALATSVDAFAVGAGFSLLSVPLLAPCMVIGAVTFLLTLSAFYAGIRLGKMIGGKAEAAGGIVLVIIAISLIK